MGLVFALSPTLSLPTLSISKSFLEYFLLCGSYLLVCKWWLCKPEMQSQTDFPCNALFSQARNFVQKSLMTLKTFQVWLLSKISCLFFFFQARWLAQATHKSISFNQIITMTNILQLFSLIYSVLIHLIQFGPRAGKMIRIPCVCNNLYPGCLDSNGSQNYGYYYH